MSKKIILDLSVWQRLMLGTIVRQQRATIENTYKAHKILDLVDFSDIELEEISLTQTTMGMSWNQTAEKRYTVVLRGKALIDWLKPIVQKFAGWTPDRFDEAIELRKQLEIVDDFDDDEDDESEGE